jgi:HSP20 family protein
LLGTSRSAASDAKPDPRTAPAVNAAHGNRNHRRKRKNNIMSILTTWNPVREMDTMRNRIDRLFGGRSLVPWTGEETISASEWSPLVDVSEGDKEFTIKADLPEVKKEDVHVTVEDGTIRITGERKFEKEEKNRRYHRIERSYGSFERSFVLPEGAKTDKVKAEFKDGTLHVHLPKAPEIQTKAVEVPVS